MNVRDYSVSIMKQINTENINTVSRYICGIFGIFDTLDYFIPRECL